MAATEKRQRGDKNKRDVSPKQSGPVYGPVQRIPLRLLERHPANRVPPAGNVAAIAESFAASGQLEPVHVHEIRDHGETVYQIVGGECRWRAAELVGWETIEARVLLGRTCGNGTVDPAVDDAYVLGLVAEHNGAREDLTPRQRAELGFALEAAGYTLTEAARRVGFRSHSTLSNFRRILRLPAEVVERVDLSDGDSRKISQEVARAIADYADVPDVLQLIVDDLDKHPEEWRDSIEDSLGYVLRELTRPMQPVENQTDWQHTRHTPHFDAGRLTDEQRQELRVVELPDGRVVATNIDAWDKVQRAADKPSGKDADESRQAGKEVPERTVAEKREQCKQRKERFASQVERWLHRWQCEWLVDQLQLGSDEVQILLGYLVLDGSMYLRGASQLAIGASRHYVTPDQRALALPRGQWPAVWQTVVRSELKQPDPPHGFRLSRALIKNLCDGVGWDTQAGWQELHHGITGKDRLESFFQLHDREQLIRLAADEFGLFVDPDGQKKVLVQRLLTHQTTLPCPACLLPAAKGAAARNGTCGRRRGRANGRRIAD